MLKFKQVMKFRPNRHEKSFLFDRLKAGLQDGKCVEIEESNLANNTNSQCKFSVSKLGYK